MSTTASPIPILVQKFAPVNPSLNAPLNKAAFKEALKEAKFLPQNWAQLPLGFTQPWDHSHAGPGPVHEHNDITSRLRLFMRPPRDRPVPCIFQYVGWSWLEHVSLRNHGDEPQDE